MTVRDKVEKLSHEDLEKAYYELKEWDETGNLSVGVISGMAEDPFVGFAELFSIFTWEMARRYYETQKPGNMRGTLGRMRGKPYDR